MLVQVCARPTGPAPGALVVRRIGAGRRRRSARSRSSRPRSTAAFRSRSSSTGRARALFVWHLAAPRPRPGRPRRRPRSTEVDGARVDAARRRSRPGGPGCGRGYIGGDPGLSCRPTAAGSTPSAWPARRARRPACPSGVWVFDDRRRCELLDHWEPRAFLSSLAASRGRPVRLRRRRRPASTSTVARTRGRHRSRSTTPPTGEIQVVYGAVARTTWLSFVAAP